MAKKGLHMYHHSSLISSPWPFDGDDHNPSRIVHIVVSRPQTPQTGCSILMERAPNDWDTTGQPQVFGRSVEEPVDPIFIGSTRRSYLHPQIHIKIWMDQKIVPISLSQPAIIDLLKIFLKKYSSQENNNLRNKMIERTYQEVLSTVVHKKKGWSWK